MRTLSHCFVLLLGFLAVGLAFQIQSVKAEGEPEIWPLAKGNFWVYEGDVSWVEENPSTKKNEIYKKKITWRSDVLDVTETQGCTFYLIKGFPKELIWYSSTSKPQGFVLVRCGTDYYEIADNADALFAKIKGQPESVRGLMDPGDGIPEDIMPRLLLPTPLAEGKRFEQGRETLRDLLSSRYCFIVELLGRFDVESVRNCPALKDAQHFSITKHTSPDNSCLHFVPGLGITHYEYHHHGTTMEVDVDLKEFGHAPQAH